MNDTEKAMIRWLPPERGGRVAPPFGEQFRTAARFEDARDRWPNESWSVVIRPVRIFEDRRVGIYTICFLSPDAPRTILSPHTRFELCEGIQVVAKGVVW